MTKARAVLFDMDGLLIDSEPLWQDAEVEIFAEVGLHLTHAQAAETKGIRIDEVVAFRFAQHPWAGPTVAEVTARMVDRMVDLVRERGQALPGVHEALSGARLHIGQVGLATSSPRSLIDATLERLGIREAFEAIASAEDEPYGKPHPAVYLTLAAKLGVPPTECIAVEDSLNGLVAAKAARMRCIAVPEAHALKDPRFALADVTLGSLVELDAARWESL